MNEDLVIDLDVSADMGLKSNLEYTSSEALAIAREKAINTFIYLDKMDFKHGFKHGHIKEHNIFDCSPCYKFNMEMVDMYVELCITIDDILIDRMIRGI